MTDRQTKNQPIQQGNVPGPFAVVPEVPAPVEEAQQPVEEVAAPDEEVPVPVDQDAQRACSTKSMFQRTLYHP
ncbi:hypothetical protein GCK72_015341 [Caenorhabditis remanei]|uniref:Uncharacterized protein n=1 Tax=Caenorhabditis remanei TaxID=31234 RepID=A0A6A5GW94_CAERE|nr:hypothetical protein GCK72_015341 [Caenorhabditis remanei]KAF1758881.1 hypothetical protein GCK72_015341 [Caenorhabditis remanei]